MMFKNISLLVLLVSASFLSTSFGGRPQVNIFPEEVGPTHEEESAHDHEEATIVHERLVRANRNDYGISDPAPARDKPRPKPVPN